MSVSQYQVSLKIAHSFGAGRARPHLPGKYPPTDRVRLTDPRRKQRGFREDSEARATMPSLTTPDDRRRSRTASGFDETWSTVA